MVSVFYFYSASLIQKEQNIFRIFAVGRRIFVSVFPLLQYDITAEYLQDFAVGWKRILVSVFLFAVLNQRKSGGSDGQAKVSLNYIPEKYILMKM